MEQENLSSDLTAGRRLPFRAWVDLLLTWPTVLLAIAFGAGMVLVWMFAVQTAPLLDKRLDDESEKTAGRIHPPVMPMGWSVGGREREGGSQIYRYSFSYEVSNRQYKGVSYSTGKAHQPGDAEIEYLPGQPEVARVAGTRVGKMGRDAVLISLLPILAFLWMAALLTKGWGARRMLALGQVAEGEVTDAQVARSTSPDRVDRWKVRFEFHTPSEETFRGTTVTDLLSEPKPGDPLDVIYLPRRPKRHRYLGELVRRLEFRGSGNYETRLSLSAASRLVFFLAATLGNLAYAIWLWLG